MCDTRLPARTGFSAACRAFFAASRHSKFVLAIGAGEMSPPYAAVDKSHEFAYRISAHKLRRNERNGSDNSAGLGRSRRYKERLVARDVRRVALYHASKPRWGPCVIDGDTGPIRKPVKHTGSFRQKEEAVFVYLIRNKINGKCYVVKTTRTVASRWRQHRTEMRIFRYDSPLYNDIREFGVSAFEVAVLGECDSQRRLAQMERAFIRRYKSVTEGYNQEVASYGGRIRRGLTHLRPSQPLPEEHRKKIAQSVRLSWLER